MWCVGHMLFELMTGSKLYASEDIWAREGGLKALYDGTLIKYLRSVGLLNCFRVKSVTVLQGLLTVDEGTRMTAAQVAQSDWYRAYHRKYAASHDQKISMFYSFMAHDHGFYPMFIRGAQPHEDLLDCFLRN